MNLLLDVFVPGVPRTKGSLDVKNAGRGGRPAVLADSELSVKWRRLVAYKARLDRTARAGPGYAALTGLMQVSCDFIVPARDWISAAAQGSGDVDKLLRNVLDALAADERKPDLAAGVYANDAQVVRTLAGKRPDFDGATPRGLHLQVWEVYP